METDLTDNAREKIYGIGPRTRHLCEGGKGKSSAEPRNAPKGKKNQTSDWESGKGEIREGSFRLGLNCNGKKRGSGSGIARRKKGRLLGGASATRGGREKG